MSQKIGFRRCFEFLRHLLRDGRCWSCKRSQFVYFLSLNHKILSQLLWLVKLLWKQAFSWLHAMLCFRSRVSRKYWCKRPNGMSMPLAYAPCKKAFLLSRAKLSLRLHNLCSVFETQLKNIKTQFTLHKITVFLRRCSYFYVAFTT